MSFTGQGGKLTARSEAAQCSFGMQSTPAAARRTNTRYRQAENSQDSSDVVISYPLSGDAALFHSSESMDGRSAHRLRSALGGLRQAHVEYALPNQLHHGSGEANSMEQRSPPDWPDTLLAQHGARPPRAKRQRRHQQTAFDSSQPTTSGQTSSDRRHTSSSSAADSLHPACTQSSAAARPVFHDPIDDAELELPGDSLCSLSPRTPLTPGYFLPHSSPANSAAAAGQASRAPWSPAVAGPQSPPIGDPNSPHMSPFHTDHALAAPPTDHAGIPRPRHRLQQMHRLESGYDEAWGRTPAASASTAPTAQDTGGMHEVGAARTPAPRDAPQARGRSRYTAADKLRTMVQAIKCLYDLVDHMELKLESCNERIVGLTASANAHKQHAALLQERLEEMIRSDRMCHLQQARFPPPGAVETPAPVGIAAGPPVAATLRRVIVPSRADRDMALDAAPTEVTDSPEGASKGIAKTGEAELPIPAPLPRASASSIPYVTSRRAQQPALAVDTGASKTVKQEWAVTASRGGSRVIPIVSPSNAADVPVVTPCAEAGDPPHPTPRLLVPVRPPTVKTQESDPTP